MSRHPHLSALEAYFDSLNSAATQKHKIRIKASDGSLHDLPAESLEAAKKRDPKLIVVRHSDSQPKKLTVGDIAGEPTHILRNGKIEKL